MMSKPINVFSGNHLDRSSQWRKDQAWYKQHLQAPESRFLAMHKLKAPVRLGDQPELVWSPVEITASAVPDSPIVLLGIHKQRAHFAVDVSDTVNPERMFGVADNLEYRDVRLAAASLPEEQAAILAQARSMLDWHATHRFCSTCGSGTEVRDAGYMRACLVCEGVHFPRTNPVVIRLVERENRCLLARQEGWPGGFVSALAGFIEPGETIEEAVRREVLEESGIDVGEVQYHSSQPWPFPSSLMIGCIANAKNEAIELRDKELDFAGWFERDSIRKALRDSERGEDFHLPPPMAIAHQLIRAWAG